MSNDDRQDADAAAADGEAAVEERQETESAADATVDDDADASTDDDPSVVPSDVDPETLPERVREYDEELAAEVDALVEGARSAQRRVAELEDELAAREEQLAEREEEVDDLTSRLKRKQADFQNYKKRAKKRQEQLKERATEDLVERLLGVRDDLKRGLDSDHDSVESLRDGVEMTLSELDRVLRDENVTEIAPEPGQEVDPQRHEVMMRVESDQPEGTIADVYKPGYEMADKVIEAAQVTVSDGDESASE